MLNESISAILSIFLPPIIDVMNSKISNSKIRYWVAIGLSVVLGVGVSFFTSNFDTQNILQSIGASFMVSQTIYKQYWGESKIRTRLQKSLQ